MNKADTCRKFIVPRLQSAGWDNHPLVHGRHVESAAELVHELDANGKQLRVVKLTDYTTEKVRTLCASPDELCARWADARQRADIVQQLAERGIDFATVAAQAGQPDADAFELVVQFDYAPSEQADGSVDRTKGIIERTGSIDFPPIKGIITSVMEGGREAFELRRQKYGF